MTLSRRSLLKLGVAGGVAAAGAASLGAGMAGGGGPAATIDPLATVRTAPDTDPTATRTEFDYIVIGSGAGGGPVAANLARAGYTVCLLEAGPFNVARPTSAVPAFHLFASSDPEISWDYYVRHYTETAQHGSTFLPDKGGVLYPRAATLGGCTAHHAMLTLYPENADWDTIAEITGDRTWNSFALRGYFDRVRRWLPIDQAPASLLLRDRVLARLVAASALTNDVVGRNPTATHVDLNHFDFSAIGLDPNAESVVDANTEGMFLIPQSTRYGRRSSVADLLIDTQKALPNRLFLQSDALVEQLVIERTADAAVCRGVQLLHGRYLYGASPRARATAMAERGSRRRSIRARREVILAAGTFNSPQLLMLSGIGPADHLREHGIEPVLDRPGVGGNLQDRYEMSVVTEFDRPFRIVDGARFGAPGDPFLREWRSGVPTSPYRTDGILVGIKKKFSQGSDHPELFIFGSPSRFDGYRPGFAERGVAGGNHFTWAVLRGYAENRIGTVRLRSADPTMPPDINFRYFDDGAGGEHDLAAIREALALARRMNDTATRLGVLDATSSREIYPGPDRRSAGALDDKIKSDAWGHHASCSNPMGPAEDLDAVVDSQFRVHGVLGLRIVDASVFPRIPGLFPVLAIHMLAEKASDAILAAAR